jgi:ATP-dependent Lon protease
VHETGTIATILQLLKLPDGTVKVLVEGKTRARVNELIDRGDYFEAEVETLEEPKRTIPTSRP